MTHYRGRFAPSPTGLLHFGSIVAAVASYADARHAGGDWLVRIEDVDQTRTRADAEAQILADLQRLDMRWDGEIIRQSEREPRYDEVLSEMIERGLVYRCSCSRKTIAEQGTPGIEGPVYPGTCRITPPGPATPAAWRVALDDAVIRFDDRIQGPVRQRLAGDIGDFVIRRVDGYTAYQLAVVIDDCDQGVTHVVRGMDLLASTPRQIWLQQVLGYPTPAYAHVPLVYGEDGRKLSKRDAAHPVDMRHPVGVLVAAWQNLGQELPARTLPDTAAFWEWAVPRWRIERIIKTRPEHD